MSRIIREITPERHQCVIGACPAVFETEGEYFLIGRHVSSVESGDINSRVGPDEAVIAIPKGLLKDLARNIT